jgi:hypothetical protein
MNKQAISVTLDLENLLWLRGQARASRRASVSAALDRLVSEARARGQVQERTIRSVVGTVHIASTNPGLRGADAAIRALFRSATATGRTRATRARAPRVRTRA